MKRKESDKITYIAPDGKKFGDLKEYMEYTETKFHNGKVVPGTVGQMFQSLRRYQDTDYVHGIVSIKEHNGNFNVQCFHTMNIENIVAPFTDVQQLNDDQKFVTATIADMKRVLNKFWDCQCTATDIVSPDRDFFAERSGRAERRSSQTFMMVNGYIMRTEPGKANRETAATPAKGS